MDQTRLLSNLFERNPNNGEWVPGGTLVSDVSQLASIRGDQVNCEDGNAGLFVKRFSNSSQRIAVETESDTTLIAGQPYWIIPKKTAGKAAKMV